MNSFFKFCLLSYSCQATSHLPSLCGSEPFLFLRRATPTFLLSLSTRQYQMLEYLVPIPHTSHRPPLSPFFFALFHNFPLLLPIFSSLFFSPLNIYNLFSLLLYFFLFQNYPLHIIFSFFPTFNFLFSYIYLLLIYFFSTFPSFFITFNFYLF